MLVPRYRGLKWSGRIMLHPLPAGQCSRKYYLNRVKTKLERYLIFTIALTSFCDLIGVDSSEHDCTLRLLSLNERFHFCGPRLVARDYWLDNDASLPPLRERKAGDPAGSAARYSSSCSRTSPVRPASPPAVEMFLYGHRAHYDYAFSCACLPGISGFMRWPHRLCSATIGTTRVLSLVHAAIMASFWKRVP